MNKWSLLCVVLLGLLLSQSVLYFSIKSEYDAINALYSERDNDATSLADQISIMQSTNDDLQSELNGVNTALSNYEAWRAYLMTYTDFDSSFSRTLTDQEIKSHETLVASIISDQEDVWGCFDELYKYVTSNVEYALDEMFPEPPTINQAS